jgi:hypothetical protein
MAVVDGARRRLPLQLRPRLDLRRAPAATLAARQVPRAWMECMNPKCSYGKAALARKPIDDAIARERYPDLFPASPQSR